MERWHTRTKQRYAQDVSTAAEQALCSSMLVPGMTVDVVLLAAVSGGVVLGAFAAPVDTPAVDAVEVYGVARYRWSGGGFVFKSWQGLPEEAQAARIPLPPGYVLEGNALLIYGGIKWDDVKETAKAQRKALADPNDPAHDPLMKAVLTALTPAE